MKLAVSITIGDLVRVLRLKSHAIAEEIEAKRDLPKRSSPAPEVTKQPEAARDV